MIKIEIAKNHGYGFAYTPIRVWFAMHEVVDMEEGVRN